MGKERINKFMILSLIKQEGKKTISELANRLNLSRPTIYLHLNTLEKGGFIKRKKDIKKKGSPVTIYLIEKKIEEKKKKEMIEALKFVKANDGLTDEGLRKFKEGNWVNTIPFSQLQFRGLIIQKLFITPKGRKFLKN